MICSSCQSEIGPDHRFEAQHAACAGDFPATRFAASQAHYLTARQREVLALVARGYSNRKIAETLRIERRTTEHHVSAILDALAPVSRQEYSRRVIAAVTFVGGNGKRSAEPHKVPMAATEDVPSPMSELIDQLSAEMQAIPLAERRDWAYRLIDVMGLAVGGAAGADSPKVSRVPKD